MTTETKGINALCIIPNQALADNTKALQNEYCVAKDMVCTDYRIMNSIYTNSTSPRFYGLLEQ